MELGGAEVDGPVLVGPGSTIGDGAKLVGPAVIGRDCAVGAGATVKEAILLDGAELAAGCFTAGGVIGR